MKNRMFVVLSIFLMTLFFNGCSYRGYSGDNNDLYTEAINTVLWNNGYSFSADRVIDSEIEIIEKDEFGRTLFTYYEKYYAGAELSFSALIISQYSLDNYVYYYEDYNYLIKQQYLYVPGVQEFTQEEIDNLKTVNDWDTQINFEKCIRKQISNVKQEIPCENNVINEKIVDKFNLIVGEYSVFFDYLTSDDNGKFIVYGVIIKPNEKNIYFAALFDTKDDNLVEFLVPTNPYDYQQELLNFKAENYWASNNC